MPTKAEKTAQARVSRKAKYVPNKRTRQAIAEIDRGKGKKTKTVDELFKAAGV